MNNLTNYGKNIKKRRIEIGMSQLDLALAVGYTDRSTISKIESGVNDITVEKFVEIARALNIEPVNLLELED